MIDVVLWWIGASIVGTIGWAGAVALFGGINVLVAMYADHYAKRYGNIYNCLRGMAKWDEAGRPVLRWVESEGKAIWIATKPIRKDVV